MTPSKKTPEVEHFITIVTGINRVDAITENICAVCGGDASEFKDELSRKEYSISGLCQKCQDEIFGE